MGGKDPRARLTVTYTRPHLKRIPILSPSFSTRLFSDFDFRVVFRSSEQPEHVLLPRRVSVQSEGVWSPSWALKGYHVSCGVPKGVQRPVAILAGLLRRLLVFKRVWMLCAFFRGL